VICSIWTGPFSPIIRNFSLPSPGTQIVGVGHIPKLKVGHIPKQKNTAEILNLKMVFTKYLPLKGTIAQFVPSGQTKLLFWV